MTRFSDIDIITVMNRSALELNNLNFIQLQFLKLRAKRRSHIKPPDSTVNYLKDVQRSLQAQIN